MRNKIFYLLFSVAFLFCGCQKTQNDVVEVSSKTVSKVEYINILTLGDNLLHLPVVNSGKQADGSYDFAHLFENIKSYINISKSIYLYIRIIG